jgi:SAM-dependent methyltransferase
MSWSWLVYVFKRARREARDTVLRHGTRDRDTIRKDVAVRFLQGDGIEIGALDFPLRLPRGARVRYVDHLDEAGLRRIHSDTLSAGRALMIPDVVDDGARLERFADGSLDFVVANHMLEHVEDPIAALENQLRVLRRGGVLYLTLPDARTSFDAPRERTTPEHLLRDHREGPEVSRRTHYDPPQGVSLGPSTPTGGASISGRGACSSAWRGRPECLSGRRCSPCHRQGT